MESLNKTIKPKFDFWGTYGAPTKSQLKEHIEPEKEIIQPANMDVIIPKSNKN